MPAVHGHVAARLMPSGQSHGRGFVCEAWRRLCPFCNLATSIFLKVHADAEYPSFDLHVADLLAEDRDVLCSMLSVPVLTYPVVFIKGARLEGGGEAVAKLHTDDGGAGLAAARGRISSHSCLRLCTHRPSAGRYDFIRRVEAATGKAASRESTETYCAGSPCCRYAS